MGFHTSTIWRADLVHKFALEINMAYPNLITNVNLHLKSELAIIRMEILVFTALQANLRIDNCASAKSSTINLNYNYKK